MKLNGIENKWRKAGGGEGTGGKEQNRESAWSKYEKDAGFDDY